MNDVDTGTGEILFPRSLETGDRGVSKDLIFAMILIWEAKTFFPNPPIKHAGKAVAPLIRDATRGTLPQRPAFTTSTSLRPCPFSLPHVAYEGRGLELWAQARAGCLRRRLKGNCTWQAATLIRIGAHKYISGARRNRDRQLVLHNRVIRVRGLARDPKSSPLRSRYRSICGSGHPSDRSPRAIGA